MSGARVLVVEDEAKLAALQRDYLAAAGFDVDVLGDGRGVVERVLAAPPDLLVLDLMLPGEDGLSICRRLREHSAVPIIMVTARVDEVDRLLGLELGADDYLCKPFSPRELVLRVRAILRRAAATRHGADGRDDVLRHADLALDLARHRCTLGDTTIELTPVEFRLLAALMQSPGRVLSRQQLQGVAYEDHRVVSDRTIDSHVRNLRQKLGDQGEGDDARALLRSVYGVGYALD
jgi:two-component system response regulator BaeR